MARQLIFDVRFRDASNVGQLVGGDIYVELYEEGETRPKEVRYLGTNSSNQIIKAVDGEGTLYTTTVDVTNYARGSVTAKWYAKLLGSPVSPYPYVESIPNVFADTELTVGDLKNYIRSMLGFPSVTVELTGAHYTAIMEEALAFYGQHIPAERVIRLNYQPSIQVYHLPDLPYNGPYDVKFVRKVVTPFACLTGDTVVRLLDGTNRTIQDLAENYPEDEMWVYSIDRKTKKYVPGRAIKPKKTGENVPVFRVTLDDGSSYRCTETHRWLLRDGSFRQCKDLAPGDSLMPLYTRISAQPRDNLSSYEMIKNLRHGDWQYASVCRGLTEDVRASIIELKVAGLSRSKIAQKTGVGEGKVRKVLEKFNHKVVSVEPCGFEDVYNLGVHDYNNYAICTLDKCGKVVSACMTGNSDPVFGREYLRSNEPDMGTMIIGNAYLETMLRVLSSEPDWRWLHETKELYINIGPGISAQVYGGYDVSVRYFVPVTLDKVREDHFRWMRRYCLAQAKKILAQIRGKFSGNVPAPGGPLVLNHEELARQGAEEEIALSDELRSMAQHVPPLFG